MNKEQLAIEEIIRKYPVMIKRGTASDIKKLLILAYKLGYNNGLLYKIDIFQDK